MNIKIGGFILVILITLAMFFGCSKEKGKKEEIKIYDINNPVIVNVGNRFLKLNISLGVTDQEKTKVQLAKILHVINQTLSAKPVSEQLEKVGTGSNEGPTPDKIAEALKQALNKHGYKYIKNIYFRAFVLQ